MDTALYYTFSTISQTLAGAIAFLGAFVLYRLQIQKENLKNIGRLVVQSVSSADSSNRLKNFLETEQYERFVKCCEGELPGDTKNNLLGENFVKFKYEKELKSRLIPKLKIALLFTIGVIVYSVLVLILTPFITTCKLVTYSVIMAVGGIGLSICLVSYYQLIMVTIFDER